MINSSENMYVNVFKRVFYLLIILFVFLVSLKLMGGAFKLFGKEIAHDIINVTANPFVSLFIGMLATAIIQSSSTTTTMIVTMVAAGSLTVEGAVPLIMGANIGTSVTSSILAFGHIGKKKEYRKAVAAATVHDFFNILVVLVLFPMEYFFGFLSGMATGLSAIFYSADNSSVEVFSIMGVTVKPVAKGIMSLLGKNGLLVLLAACTLLFFSLRGLTSILKKFVIGKAEKNLNKVVFQNPFAALGWGAGLTVLVQSSSVTTSLVVPLVASNKVSLRKAFPFLMGANIGTTVTAIIAAMAAGEAALTIAFAHLLFNVLGTVIFFPVRSIRDIPLRLARGLGKLSLKNRSFGILYVVITFFVVPFLFFILSDTQKVISQYNYEVLNEDGKTVSYSQLVTRKLEKGSEWETFEGLSNEYNTADIEPIGMLVSKDEFSMMIGDIAFPMKESTCIEADSDSLGRYKVCYDATIHNFKAEGFSIRQCHKYVLTTVDSTKSNWNYFYNPSLEKKIGVGEVFVRIDELAPDSTNRILTSKRLVLPNE